MDFKTLRYLLLELIQRSLLQENSLENFLYYKSLYFIHFCDLNIGNFILFLFDFIQKARF